MSAEPLVVCFDSADPAVIDRVLGAAQKALLGGRFSVLALDIRAAGMNRFVLDAFTRWFRRSGVAIAERVEAMIYVAPSWWASILIKVDLRGTPPLVPYTVVRSLDAGMAWVASRRPSRRSAPSSRSTLG